MCNEFEKYGRINGTEKLIQKEKEIKEYIKGEIDLTLQENGFYEFDPMKKLLDEIYTECFEIVKDLLTE